MDIKVWIDQLSLNVTKVTIPAPRLKAGRKTLEDKMKNILAKINFIRQRKPLKIISIGLVFFMVIFGVFLIFRPAFASILTENFGFWLANNVLLPIASFLGKLLVMILNLLIAIIQYNDFVNNPAVQNGWSIIRDVCNMFFIIVLLIIAFGTVFNIQRFKYNQLLGKLVMMIILINFSKMIAGFFIDLSQVVMMTFVNGFRDAAAANFATSMGLREMLEFRNVQQKPPQGWEAIGIGLLAIAMLVVALVVIIAMFVVFLMRIIMLWILVVLSPLAYLLNVLPGKAAGYASKWWESFGKYCTVGPVMAFFIWLAFVVTSSWTTAPEGGEKKSLTEDILKVTVNQADQERLAGNTNVSELSATISEAGTSNNILSFIISISMLVGALMVAQQAGGVAGQFAGAAMGKVKGMGMGALKTGLAPVAGAYKLGTAGIKKGTGYVGRKLEESRFAYVTPTFWKGFFKRGERLGEEAKTLAAGKGEYLAERFYKGTLKGKKGREVALDREEMARRQVINARKSDFTKELGKAGESRQAMQDMARRAFYTEGHEGEIVKQAFLELATEKGNLDDVFFAFGDLYFKDEKTRNNINEQFGKLGYSEEDIGKMFMEYNGDTIKQFTTSFLGLDRKLVKGGKEAGTAKGVSTADQNRFRALAGISEAAKDVGHWEQFMATRDAKTGRYYAMDERERRDEIVGEAKKRGMRDFLHGVAPHVFLKRVRKEIKDEEGNVIGEDYVPDEEAAEEGTFEHEMFQRLLGGQHVPELRQMQSRIPDQLIAKYFDNLGNLIDTEEEAVAKGFKAAFGKTALENLHGSFRKTLESNQDIFKAMWSLKYLSKPTERPGPDRGNRYPWETGYKQSIEASEIDEYRENLDRGIEYGNVEEIFKKHAPEATPRAIFATKEILTDTDYAGRFGMITRGNVISRAEGMGLKNVQWKMGDKKEQKKLEAEENKLKGEIEALNKEIETGKNLATGAELTKEQIAAKKEQVAEKGEKKKVIGENKEKEEVKGGWINKEGAEKVIGILADEIKEDFREKLEEEVKKAIPDVKGKGPEVEKMNKEIRAKRDKLIDELMDIGIKEMPEVSVKPKEPVATKEYINKKSQKLSDLAGKKEAAATEEEKNKINGEIQNTLDDLGQEVNRQRQYLIKKMQAASKEEKPAIQKEIDELNAKNFNPQTENAIPSSESLGVPVMEEAFKRLSESTEDMRDALESTVGSLKDFPVLAQEMADNLDNFIKSLEKCTASWTGDQKKVGEQLTEHLKGMQHRASEGAKTGFAGNDIEQKQLLWQMVQLTRVMKEKKEGVSAKATSGGGAKQKPEQPNKGGAEESEEEEERTGPFE